MTKNGLVSTANMVVLSQVKVLPTIDVFPSDIVASTCI